MSEQKLKECPNPECGSSDLGGIAGAVQCMSCHTYASNAEIWNNIPRVSKKKTVETSHLCEEVKRLKLALQLMAKDYVEIDTDYCNENMFQPQFASEEQCVEKYIEKAKRA